MTRLSSTDMVVVGGGIIGTATAAALVKGHPGLTVTILEKEPCLAAHQTGHNSGVIHSGLYYRTGTEKAVNCVAGREELYRFCAERGIPFERCGKIVVATREEELPELERLEQNGRNNGLSGIQRLRSQQEIRQFEPEATGIEGIHVPQTGIVDYRAVTEALAQEVRSRQGVIRTSCRLQSVERQATDLLLGTSEGSISCRMLVNCAGLHSDRVARMCGLRPSLRILPFRGEYYNLIPSRRSLVKNLIYPVRDPRYPFLGVHFTRTTAGECEAGPNAVLALKREGYRRLDISPLDVMEMALFPGFWKLAARNWREGVNEYRRSFSRKRFASDLQRLVPALGEEDVRRGGAGVRAQAVDREGRMVDDFVFLAEEGMLHVLNAPSPAATASLCLGRKIAARAVGQLL